MSKSNVATVCRNLASSLKPVPTINLYYTKYISGFGQYPDPKLILGVISPNLTDCFGFPG
jgi:hypothetical protein